MILQGGRPARVIGPLAIGGRDRHRAGGAGQEPGRARVGAGAADRGRRDGCGGAGARPGVTRDARIAALIAAVAVLLMAPGAWAFETLGHATSGTFPAGGPAERGLRRPGGRPRVRGWRRAGAGGPPGMAAPGGAAGRPVGPAPGWRRAPAACPAGSPRAAPAPARAARRRHVRRQHAVADRGARLRQAARRRHARRLQPVRRGQPADRARARDVAAIGGFSGRESQVSVDWLADAVAGRPHPLGARPTAAAAACPRTAGSGSPR